MNYNPIQTSSKSQRKQAIKGNNYLIERLLSYPESKLHAFAYIAKASITQQHVYSSQQHIAKKTGYCRKTMNVAYRELHQAGIIKKVNRGWDNVKKKWLSNIYIIDPLFKDKEILKQLAFHVPFTCLGIAFLFSVSTLHIEKVTRVLYNNDYTHSKNDIYRKLEMNIESSGPRSSLSRSEFYQIIDNADAVTKLTKKDHEKWKDPFDSDDGGIPTTAQILKNREQYKSDNNSILSKLFILSVNKGK